MNKKGFTLIELLIVISIIGILAVALVPSISDAPARARDAGRKATVNEIVAAVESFNIDTSDYPAGTFCIDDSGDVDSDQEILEDDYLGEIPTTTSVNVNGDCDTHYYYERTADGYIVGTYVETTGTGTIDLGGDAGSQEVFEIER